ncbi:MAG: hypothetical protein JNK05_29340 [Myxococcales bacterium]|nr:hypothetical protein [Myxococcales bacterium]
MVALCAAACSPTVPTVRDDRSRLARGAGSDPRGATTESDAGLIAAIDATVDAGPRDPLLALADEITERMVAVRQLPRRTAISSGLLSREQIIARLRARVAEEYRGDELQREGLLYRTVGLWNDPRDYAETSFALLEEQVAGFYDPTRKQLYVAGWLSPFSQGPTLAHEITHALQDQSFDIARFTRHEQGAGDRQLAAMTVVEGDATLATVAFSSGQRALLADTRRVQASLDSGVGGGEQIASAPLVLRETLVFPYREGLRLCASAYQSGGWRAVDALLREPPQSTEQLLHSEKLAAREAPEVVSVALPPSLATTHEAAYHETFGELGVRLWLQTYLPPETSADAAAGWGGDSALLLVPRGTTTVTGRTPAASLWVITMDASPFQGEALALERAVVGLLRLRYPRATRARLDGVTHALRTSRTTVSLVAHRGRTVLVAEGIAADRAAQVVREALANVP